MTKLETIFKIKIKDYYQKIHNAFKDVNNEKMTTYEITDDDIIKAEKDFSWIYSLINSCKTYQQYDSALNLVTLFRKKYPFAIVIERVLQRRILNKQKEFYIE